MSDRVLSDETGDGPEINLLLQTTLDPVRTDASGWMILYRERETDRLWELSYPHSEMHGGGPRLLRKIDAAETSL